MKAYDRLKQQEAAKAIQDGRIRVPLRCSHCASGSILPSEGGYDCVQCGRYTRQSEAHQKRILEMRKIIQTGIDPPRRKA